MYAIHFFVFITFFLYNQRQTNFVTNLRKAHVCSRWKNVLNIKQKYVFERSELWMQLF